MPCLKSLPRTSAWLALALPLGLAQEPDAPLPTPHDRVLELELTAGDPPLIEGRGPAIAVELELEFSGTLHLWTRSELELGLRVEDASDGRVLGEDDDTKGGEEPYVQLNVEAGARLAVLIASSGPDGLGRLELHVRAAPESTATRAAARVSGEGLAEARQLLGQGDLAAARARAAELVGELLATPGAAGSEAVSAVAWELGYLALECDDLESAHAAWSATRRYCERTLPADHILLLRAGAILGDVKGELGDLAGARALLESVLLVYERRLPDDDPELLSARNNLGTTLARAGDPAAAGDLFASVLAARERSLPPEHPGVLQARLNLANTLSVQGDFAGARALLEAIVAARERTLAADHPDLLTARHGLAITLQELGDLEGERALKEAVLAARERTLPADHPALLSARNSLAVTMLQQGDLAGARALQEAVLAGCERTLPAGHPDLLSARASLAGTLRAEGELAAARALEESVLAAREETLAPGHRDLFVSRRNLADTLAEEGDLVGARALQEADLALSESTLPADHPDLLTSRANLAGTLRAAGELGAARALLESVVASYERTLSADHPDLLRARGNLALTMHQQNDLAGAAALVPAQVAGMRARVLGSLALAPRQAGEAVAAEAHRLAGALFLTRAAAPELQARVFELQETMRMVAGEAARALYGTRDPEIRSLLGEAATVRSELGELVAGASEEGRGERLSRLMQERDRLERAASRLQAERGVVTQAIELAPLARALGDEDALAAYRRVAHWDRSDGSREVEVGSDHLLVHVLARDGALARIDLGEAAQLEELVTSWRAAMGAPSFGRGVAGVAGPSDARREREAGAALRARLLDPVLARLDGTVRRLFVCADDLVFLVPLDALPSDGGRGDGRVGDRLSIASEVSCARLAAPGRGAGGGGGLLALGGVDHDAGAEAGAVVAAASARRGSTLDSFAPLPHTLREAETTASLCRELLDVEPVLLTGREATRAALLEQASGKRFLHLATHGWFAPETIRSSLDEVPGGRDWSRTGVQQRVTGMAPMLLCGLALAGANRPIDSLGRRPGILTAEELCSLDLSACELAVLSACETNVGIRRAGQGIQSLQAALYAAGARSSITSLWKVDDAATRRLFELFYTKLWEEKVPEAKALWEAKRMLRDEGAPVRDWAAWVLTGDPE